MAEQVTGSSASNPYAAPQAAVEDVASGGLELATRWQRFAASLIDGIR